MSLHTRFTERFGIEHPIVSAPMDVVSTAALATAVSRAGGLGLIGGGYGDKDWLSRELAAAAGTPVGCGFITWSIDASHIDIALAHEPAAIFLSFGDASPYVGQIHQAGVPLICQVHDLGGVEEALQIGADVVCVQGGEAGGHGKGTRSTFTLVPEAADLIADQRPEVLLLAAGGIADGRSVAAALALGRTESSPAPASGPHVRPQSPGPPMPAPSPSTATRHDAPASTTSSAARTGQGSTPVASWPTTSSSAGTATRPSWARTSTLPVRSSHMPSKPMTSTSPT